MARYDQPRKLNLVSLLVFLALAAAIYSVVQFGPPYWRQFKVKQVLKDAAYRYGKYPAVVDETRGAAQVRIRKLGIEDAVQIEFKRGGGTIEAIATYREIVKHPLIDKITTLRFAPAIEVKDQKYRD